jgi:hypothetical protein
MTSALKQRLFLFLRLAIGLGLLGYIFHEISLEGGLSQLPGYYAQADLLCLAAAIAIMGLLFAAGAFRWGLLLRAQGVKLSPGSVFMYYMIGMFFNSFLPSTVGGDVVKVYYLSRFTKKGPAALASVAVDRLMGVGGMCVMAVVALLFGAGKLRAAIGPKKAASIFLIVGGVSAGLILFFLVVFSERLLRWLTALIPWAAFRKKITDVHDALCVYRGQSPVLVKTLLISTVIWVIIVTDTWLISRVFRATIPPISIWYFFLFIPTISVIMSLPISFSGLGTREAAFILFFGSLACLDPDGLHPDVAKRHALMLSLNFYFVSLAASLVGGVIYILKDQLRFHRGEVVPGEDPGSAA